MSRQHQGSVRASDEHRDHLNMTGHALGSLQRSLPTGGRSTSTDSWIEISSQPSSSSLSSANNDDAATTGLRVQHDSNDHRRHQPHHRRRLRPGAPSHLNIANRAPSTSSQDEYDESESESDRVMSSSNEGLQFQAPSLRNVFGDGNTSSPSPLRQPYASSEDGMSEDVDVPSEDDTNTTAVNFRLNAESCFTPQPNAFTHPPSSHAARPHSYQGPVPGSYFPSQSGTSNRPSSARSSSQRQPPLRQSEPGNARPQQQQHTPYNVISPSYQVDHDAALRASLSTLLSCAAAARGLPKTSTTNTAQPSSSRSAQPSQRIQPTSLRLVPESAVFGEEASLPRPAKAPRRSGSPATSSTSEKSKRKSPTVPRSSSKDRRSLKKPRRSSSPDAVIYSGIDGVHPTLLTWVVSAGVVVLVSAISFSAGYVVGREAGRVEGLGGMGGSIPGCGTEAGKEVGRVGSGIGLRRLRWGAASTVKV